MSKEVNNNKELSAKAKVRQARMDERVAAEEAIPKEPVEVLYRLALVRNDNKASYIDVTMEETDWQERVIEQFNADIKKDEEAVAASKAAEEAAKTEPVEEEKPEEPRKTPVAAQNRKRKG